MQVEAGESVATDWSLTQQSPLHRCNGLSVNDTLDTPRTEHTSHVRGLERSGMVRYAYYLSASADVINAGSDQNPVDLLQGGRPVPPQRRQRTAAPRRSGLLREQALDHPSRGDVPRQGYIAEAPYAGGHVQISALSSHGDHHGAMRLHGPGGGSPNRLAPSRGSTHVWVGNQAEQLRGRPEHRAAVSKQRHQRRQHHTHS